MGPQKPTTGSRLCLGALRPSVARPFPNISPLAMKPFALKSLAPYSGLIGSCLFGLCFGSESAAQLQVPYATGAAWESAPSGVSTGGALADIDGDGHLDVVIANGNDILRQRVEVYTNDGTGGFPTNAGWSSADSDYHGHLSVGDIDRDGFLDVAVAVFLGPGGFGTKGGAKAYFNQGGTLESTPSWTTADRSFAFACDLGDADSDGDLDLALATGEPYFDPPDQNRIYFNSGGALATTPGWLSASADHALGLAFGDIDGDGDLDLAFAPTGAAAQVYLQGPSGMATTPGWTATDSSTMFGNTVTWADVDGDGDLELGVTDNNQLSGGAGVFKLYDNLGSTLSTTPFWTDFGGQVSGIALADLTGDSLPEVATGVWFGGTRIYTNQGGTIANAQAWDATKNNTVEVLVFGDVDGDGLQTVAGETQAPNGGRLFNAAHAPLQSLTRVVVDGVELTASEYSWDRTDGWVALDRTPSVDVVLDYVWSDSLDLLSTSWDQSIGNLLYLRYPVARAVFRNDAGGTNPAVLATNAPAIAGSFQATVDLGPTGNTLAGVVGFASPLEVATGLGVLLVNPVDPAGELLGLPVQAGSGVVSFSAQVPSDLALLGFSLSAQGFGLGGIGVQLYNASDLVVGG